MGITILFSTGLFALMMLLGRILLFIDQSSLWCIPLFFIFLCLLQKGYQEGTCKTMEVKDFLYSLLIVIVFIAIRTLLGMKTSLDETSYYYLASFLSISGFASSIRFKSLL